MLIALCKKGYNRAYILLWKMPPELKQNDLYKLTGHCVLDETD